MKIEKRHVVMAALVLALSTAIYINYQFSETNTAKRTKELGAASYVSATVSSTATDDEAVATAALTKQQTNFFATERTKRQTMQGEVLDTAQKAFELESATAEEKSEAQENVEKIISFFTIQDSIETIVKAKGFSECLCCVTDTGVTVIVPANELNENTSLSIYDAVTTHYDVENDAISIVGA